jgi:hypothetical protein
MAIIERLTDFASRLEFCKQVKPDQYISRCPAHADKSPSLSFGLGRNGDRIVINCYAGCTPESVIEAVGMQMSDLFPDDPYLHVSGPRRHRQNTPDVDELIVRICIDHKKQGKDFSPKDKKDFADAVKRESRRLGRNALDYYMEIDGGVKA